MCSPYGRLRYFALRHMDLPPKLIERAKGFCPYTLPATILHANVWYNWYESGNTLHRIVLL